MTHGKPDAAQPLQATIGRVEIPAAAPAAVTTFFEQVFGWTSRQIDHSGAAYRSSRPSEGPALGVSASRDDVPEPFAVLDLQGASLEAALSRIVEAGGEIDLPPRAVGTYGRFARFRDPAGNLFGLWTTEDP